MKMMRILLLLLIAATLFTGCDRASHTKELELTDFIFAPEAFDKTCSLKATDFDNRATGNPVLSSEHEYANSIVAQWFDEEISESVEGILLSIYHGENKAKEVGLFAIEFDSNSAAKSAEDFLKNEYPEEAQNTIDREENFVIWLWQDAQATDLCFDKLNDLVEEELNLVRFDIKKHF